MTRIDSLVKPGVCGLAVFAMAVLVWPTTVAADIGKATTVVSNVTGTTNAATKRIVINDNVEQNEIIATAADAATEIQFADGTAVKVGPNSKVVLDKFIYDPTPSKGALALSISTGVLRFTTGNMPHENYKITTPDGTLGVRGTDLTVTIHGPAGTIVDVLSGVVVGFTGSGGEVTFGAGQFFTLLNGSIGPSTADDQNYSNQQEALLTAILLAGINPAAGAPGNALGDLLNSLNNSPLTSQSCVSPSKPGPC